MYFLQFKILSSKQFVFFVQKCNYRMLIVLFIDSMLGLRFRISFARAFLMCPLHWNFIRVQQVYFQHRMQWLQISVLPQRAIMWALWISNSRMWLLQEFLGLSGVHFRILHEPFLTLRVMHGDLRVPRLYQLFNMPVLQVWVFLVEQWKLLQLLSHRELCDLPF